MDEGFGEWRYFDLLCLFWDVGLYWIWVNRKRESFVVCNELNLGLGRVMGRLNDLYV